MISRGSLSLDLQDMSLMVLSCNGPDELFDSHKLVLNVPVSDSKRVRVFCARGEWPDGALSSQLHPCLSSPPHFSLFFFHHLFVTLITAYKQPLHQYQI